MDVIDMRVVITLVSFVCFIGIVFWAYSGDQNERFDGAANLPFADDEMQARTIRQGEATTVSGRVNERESAIEQEVTDV